jgi:hypothetical protein
MVLFRGRSPSDSVRRVLSLPQDPSGDVWRHLGYNQVHNCKYCLLRGVNNLASRRVVRSVNTNAATLDGIGLFIFYAGMSAVANYRIIDPVSIGRTPDDTSFLVLSVDCLFWDV